MYPEMRVVEVSLEPVKTVVGVELEISPVCVCVYVCVWGGRRGVRGVLETGDGGGLIHSIHSIWYDV
jgi:hypothetical protein